MKTHIMCLKIKVQKCTIKNQLSMIVIFKRSLKVTNKFSMTKIKSIKLKDIEINSVI